MNILFRSKASPMAKGFKNQQKVKQTFTVMLIRASHRYVLLALILSLIILACINILKSTQSSVTESPLNSKVLKIWSDKGSTLEEDEALQKIISNWEQQSGNKIKLTFYTNDELPQKTQRALQAGNSPDLVINSSAERELYPRLAWEGKLADVSDVIEPVKSIYSEGVLEAVRLYNNVDKKPRYLPVMKPVWKDSLWTNPADLHLSTATQTLTKDTRPFYIVQNPAYSLVLEENIWGKALNQIVVNSISPEEAADTAIERIKQIFDEWQ